MRHQRHCPLYLWFHLWFHIYLWFHINLFCLLRPRPHFFCRAEKILGWVFLCGFDRNRPRTSKPQLGPQKPRLGCASSGVSGALAVLSPFLGWFLPVAPPYYQARPCRARTTQARKSMWTTEHLLRTLSRSRNNPCLPIRPRPFHRLPPLFAILRQ